MSLKYAIIGCGRISPNHIAAALENKIDIVALCDVEESKMDTTIKNFKLSDETKKYVDYDFVQIHAKAIFDTKNALKHVEARENIELL